MPSDARLSDSPWSSAAFGVGLAQARRRGLAFEPFDTGQPTTLAEAYAGQAAAIRAWSERVAGWKVGRIADPAGLGVEDDRFVGPIFVSSVQTAQSARDVMAFDVVEGGEAALEVELVVRLTQDIAPQDVYAPQDVLALIDQIHLAIEIAGSPAPNLNARSPLLSIAAFGNNLGLILGPAISAQTDLDAIVCEALIDGQVVGMGGVGKIPGGVATALAFAINKTNTLGRPLHRGALISTGALTGIHPVSAGQRLTARFHGLGEIQALTCPLAPSSAPG